MFKKLIKLTNTFHSKILPRLNRLLSLALQKFDPEKMQCTLSFIRNNAMCNGVLRAVAFMIHFLTCFSSDHNKNSMANAHKYALYDDSLRIKIACFFFEKFYIL